MLWYNDQSRQSNDRMLAVGRQSPFRRGDACRCGTAPCVCLDVFGECRFDRVTAPSRDEYPEWEPVPIPCSILVARSLWSLIFPLCEVQGRDDRLL